MTGTRVCKPDRVTDSANCAQGVRRSAFGGRVDRLTWALAPRTALFALGVGEVPAVLVGDAHGCPVWPMPVLFSPGIGDRVESYVHDPCDADGGQVCHKVVDGPALVSHARPAS